MLQCPLDCIPHPYHMFTKCFCTLICCGWAYGCTLSHCYASGGLGGFLENWRYGSNVKSYCKVMVETPKFRRLHPTSISYAYKGVYLIDMLWMGIWVNPHTVMHLYLGVAFWKIEGIAEPEEGCFTKMAKAPKPRRLHLTSISYVYKVL